MTTIVTSFLLQRDGSATHSLSKYFYQFKRLRENVDCKIILFLDKSIPVYQFMHENTIIIPININETETCQLVDDIKDPIINFSDNYQKKY
jgi:hypothetical protein